MASFLDTLLTSGPSGPGTQPIAHTFDDDEPDDISNTQNDNGSASGAQDPAADTTFTYDNLQPFGSRSPKEGAAITREFGFADADQIEKIKERFGPFSEAALADLIAFVTVWVRGHPSPLLTSLSDR